MRRCTAVVAIAGLLAFAANGVADAQGAPATASYLRADYALVRAVNEHRNAMQGELNKVLANVRSHCPAAAANTPQNGESTLLSDEVIGAMVLNDDRLLARPIRGFLRAVAHLHWRQASVNRAVHGYVGDLKAMVALPLPPLCKDVRTWATDTSGPGGSHVLTSFTRKFAPRFMDLWVSPGAQPAALERTEGRSLRALGRRTAAREQQIAEFEAQAVETYTAIMNALELWP